MASKTPASRGFFAVCPPPDVTHPELRAAGLALRHCPGWLVQPDQLFQQLIAAVPWRQEHIRLFGRTHSLPRLTCWMADPGCGYRYSGLSNVIGATSAPSERLPGRHGTGKSSSRTRSKRRERD